MVELTHNGAVHVRAATPQDAWAIADVHVRSWQGAYRDLIPDEYLDNLSVAQRAEFWKAMVEAIPANGQMTYVLVDDERILGFTHTCPSRDPDAPGGTGEVASIYLVPESWGTGSGRRLMDAALGWLTDAGYTTAILWVLTSNARARRFYEAGGWRSDGTEKSETIQGAPVVETRYRRRLDPPG
jgi:GNAT superfamily N-acetyltransferase